MGTQKTSFTRDEDDYCVSPNKLETCQLICEKKNIELKF